MTLHGGSHSGYASASWNDPYLTAYLQEAAYNADGAFDQAWRAVLLLKQLSSNQLKAEAVHALREQEERTVRHYIEVQLDLSSLVVVAQGVKVEHLTMELLEPYNLCCDHC